MSSDIRIIETSDGSQSLYNPQLRETYHSTHGALTESRHVFIQMGLEHLVSQGSKSINILEVGLGTGLNALLSVEYARLNPQVHLAYHTLEPYPLQEEIISRLKYAEFMPYEGAKDDFVLVHTSDWGRPNMITQNFEYTRDQQKVEELTTDLQFDLIYFDAFAPNKQAEVWKKAVLQNVFNHMITGAVLVTYCAQGQFKRDLTAIGFSVETLDGPPGKKEMVRATK